MPAVLALVPGTHTSFVSPPIFTGVSEVTRLLTDPTVGHHFM